MASDYLKTPYLTTRNGGADIEPKMVSRPWLTRKELAGDVNRDDENTQAAVMMLEQVTSGKSLGQIAKEFGISPRTAALRIKRAENAGVLRNARQQLIDELLGESMKVMRAALTGKDAKLAVQVALKIADGLEVFKDLDHQDELNNRKLAAAESVMDVDSFEVYRARVTRKHRDPLSPGSSSNAEETDSSTVEGILLRSEPETSQPTAATEDSPQDAGEPDSETGLQGE